MLIRDAVHGDIELSAVETRVLDLPEVQRLRAIKQLGTAYLVYPSALHSRFDHSLGACAVAHRILRRLQDAGQLVSRHLSDAIGAAALLHDVTHVSFGHTLEDERRLFPRHDKGTRLSMLLEGPLGDKLEALGLREAINSLLGGACEYPAWARDIVSSTIDADLLDYLRRDSYFTGLKQDYDDRVFRYFTVQQGRLALQMTKHGMERPDARSEIVQLLRMRYFLTERVYYHHTKVVAGAMISKAVELALDEGVLAEADLLRFGDWTLLDHLERHGGAATRKLMERLRRRELLKRGYVLSARNVGAEARSDLVQRYHSSRQARHDAEAFLASTLGCEPGEVIVYCPALTVMKEAAALVTTPDGLRRLNEISDAGLGEIRALEERYAGLWRFYVFVPASIAPRCSEAARELFGFASEHACNLRGPRSPDAA